MPTSILIQIPDTLREYRPYLHEFMKLMVMKLHKNAHKQTPTVETLPTIMDLLREEIKEFEDQININKFDFNSLVELADQANFSFLAYVALRLQGVENGDKTGDPKPK